MIIKFYDNNTVHIKKNHLDFLKSIETIGRIKFQRISKKPLFSLKIKGIFKKKNCD